MLEIINKWNIDSLNYLNSFGENELIKKIVFIFADAPIFFLPVFLLGFWIYYSINNKHLPSHSKGEELAIKKEYNQNKKIKLLTIFYSIIFSIIISLIIQQFISIERPEQFLSDSSLLLLKHIPDASFPSDHATVSFAFLTGLFLAGFKKIGYIFLPFVIIMNLSRVIAGIHWPLDIIAGTVVGIISSFIVFKFCKKNKFVKKINLGIMKISSYIKL